MKQINIKLNNKKYKKPNGLIHTIYYLISSFSIFPKIKCKVNKIDDHRDCKGPCFIIYNHLSRPDHAHILKATYPRRYNMVAGYNEFYRKKFKLVFGLENVIPKGMFDKALQNRTEKTYACTNTDEIITALNEKGDGFVKAMWCGEEACEDEVKEKTGVGSRCIPFEQEQLSDKCVCCGKPAKHMVYWGKAY